MARNLRAVVTTSVTIAALGAGALALSAPALADPSRGAYRTYVGVGSDTIQDVENAIAGDVAGITRTTTKIGSYDAFGSATIKTRSTGPSFVRPAGSGAGVKALSDAMTGTAWNGVDVTGQVDYARSSAGPSAAGTDLAYIPFARDAVSYAYRGVASKVGKLTTAQLRQLYSSNTPTKINGVVIKPLLPQSSSGTRKFFLSAIGVTQLGSQVVETNQPENNGTVLTANNQVIPFSAAQWISQVNGVVTNTTANDKLGAPDGTPAARTNQTTQLLQPNPAFFGSAYGRNVYNVIPTSRISDAGLAAIFVGSTSTFCKGATQTIVKQYGFASVGSACGSTSTQGPYTPASS